MTSKRVLRYRKPRALLVQRFSDMKCRTKGKYAGDKKSQLWLGLELEERDKIIEWALEDPGFKQIFGEWEADGFARRSSPTAHRINRAKGYTVDNIEWRKHAEKSRTHLEVGKVTRARKKLATV